MLTARDQGALDDVATAVTTLGRNAVFTARTCWRGRAGPAGGQRSAQHFGGLDILVNNAGAARRGDFLKLTDDDWEPGFGLEFFAQVRLCRAAWPMLKTAAARSLPSAALVRAPRSPTT